MTARPILTSMNDYDRVARVIRYLDGNRGEQPRLDRLAAVAGVSPFHFHRLFRRWAGVTPKGFLQCLTVEDAKRRLRESASVLDAALGAGLSGPGRLHDLMVTLEAASPGEYKDGGKGIEIRWGRAETPYGPCTLGWTRRGVCHLSFGKAAGLRRDWPKARLVRRDAEGRSLARRIFSPRGKGRIGVLARGTPFQIAVWRALLAIPPGRLASYSGIAAAVGRPRAVRAVAAACGANAVAWLIPCHRVIRGTGAIHGYRWGRERKRAMIAREMVGNATGSARA